MLTQITAWLSKKRFIQASQSGNAHKIQLSIGKVDQETKDTALICAANGGHEDVAKILLNKGANPQARDDQGFTALIWAAYQGHEDTVHMMLTQGVDPNQKTKDGRTALMWAAKAGREDTLECFSKLGNADLEAQDGAGFTALMHAAYSGHADIVKTLLKCGANPNFRAKNNETALMWAADRGQSKIVQILLDAGADPNTADSDGKTALMWAATQKQGRTGNYVPGASAQRGMVTMSGSAGVMGNDFLDLKTVKILLEKDIDINAKDRNGETALTKAINYRYTEIIQILKEAGAN